MVSKEYHLSSAQIFYYHHVLKSFIMYTMYFSFHQYMSGLVYVMKTCRFLVCVFEGWILIPYLTTMSTS